MRPLRFAVNLTLDGCVDHLAGIPSEAVHRHAAGLVARADALIFGRVTYGMMEEAWRVRPGPRPDWMQDWMEPFRRTIDAAKKYVVSTTLKQVDWNAELLRGDWAASILELKRQPGRELFVGGLQLAQALTERRLIDEYEFMVHPRVAGRGPALFAGLSAPVDLKLVDHRDLGDGTLVLRYAPGW